MRLKTLGAATVGTLALGACSDPVAGTDLRPEGPPEVLAVLVFNDPSNGVIEAATYCKPNDPKRPGKVGIPFYGLNPVICPIDGTAVPELTDAYPDGWYVRVMFDELLDPDIETLEPILDAMGNPTDNFSGSLATTQPVTLRCQDVTGALTDVDYDGYYSPSGNAVTWPLGPSLVIQPLDPTIVPVDSECEITLKESVKDKDGNSVPTGDRSAFKFKLAPVSVLAVSPAEGDSITPATGGVEVDFNVELDGSQSFCADNTMPSCFHLVGSGNPANPDPGGLNIDFGDSSNTNLFIGADLLGDQTYNFSLPADFQVKDKCGKLSKVAGAPDPYDFETVPAAFVSFNPGGGASVAPSKKITLSFNQAIDPATFTEDVAGTPGDYTIEPKPAGVAPVGINGNTQIRFNGDYNLATTYKLTIKAGAVISDAYGKQTITFDTDKVLEFTTASAITITAQSPANGARVTKGATATQRISLTFNQEMLASSLDASEVSLVKASDGSAVAIVPTFSTSTGAAAGTTVRAEYAALPAGSYKFTLKAGATLIDKIAPTPNTYTQAADRVISFTVADSPPAGPDFKCLGAP